MIHSFLLLLLAIISLYGQEAPVKTNYPLNAEPIDVVIPCAEKDLATLELCIQGIRANGQNIRRVIVVSQKPLTRSAEWIDEKIYPFSKRSLMIEIFHGDQRAADRFLENPRNRSGWIFQQLLKLYAPFVIPEISSNVLILDSDVIFLNPTAFMTDQGEPIFNTGKECHPPYFEHMNRLLPGLRRVHSDYSGVCNYMLFQRAILEDLFARISNLHGLEAWRAICYCIDPNEIMGSALSEYEIYFNFTLLNTDQAQICQLRWTTPTTWENMKRYRRDRFSYITCHEWTRPPGSIVVKD